MQDKPLSNNQRLTAKTGLKSADGVINLSDDDFSMGSVDLNLPIGEDTGDTDMETMDWITNSVSLPDLTYVLESYSPEHAKKQPVAVTSSGKVSPNIDAQKGSKKKDVKDYQDEIISLFG